MADKFYAKSPGNNGYIKNLECLGFCDWDRQSGAFQMQIYRTADGRYYIYGSAFGGVHGASVVIAEITDPEHPRFVKRLFLLDPEEYPTTSTPKIQVADGLLICAMTSGSGPGALVEQSELMNIKSQQGIQIWSIAEDPENPKYLGYWDCGVPHSIGVHRFMYNGGKYVYLSCEHPRMEGMIMRIVDISDPAHPVEVGNWWEPSQFVDGYPCRTVDHHAGHNPEFMHKPWMHGPPFRRDDGIMVCGYCGAGLYVLDATDVTRPRALGHLPLIPLFGSRLCGASTHSALPLPGRDLVVVTNEGERFQFFKPGSIQDAQAMNNLHMVDIRDPSNPVLIAEFPYPEVPEDFPYPNFNVMNLGCQGPFGPHNVHEPMSHKPWLEQSNALVYNCYFAAGLRIFDVRDPYYIKEVAYFIPPNPVKKPEESFFRGFPGPRNAVTEDCCVDDRGYIYVTCLDDGFYVLKRTGKAAEINAVME